MSTGFKGPIVFGPETNQKRYPYRTGCGMFPSAEWFTFFDDFLGAEESDSLSHGGWLTITDTGKTLVNGDTHAGSVVISSDGASEGIGFYLPKCIQLASKKFFMEVRVKTDDADDTDVQFGLSDLSATSDPEDLWDTSNADGIAAGVLDGDATVVLVYDKNNGGPVTETGTIDLANDTFATLAIAYDGGATPGDSSLRLYVNGQEAAAAATEAQVPEDVVLAPFFAARTGGDANHTITFDYFRFSVER